VKPSLAIACFLLTFVILTLLQCSPSARFSSTNATNQEYPNHNSSEGEIFYGESSYYAEKFHGRKTANGEIFDMYKKTAAHKSIPFNTLLEVTNLENNKSVIVRVNDRGPFVGNRILDLSYGAAREIDMISSGVVEVKIKILKWGR
jgi:rare lipoprotein A